MCQGPELTMNEEEYMIEEKIENLNVELEIYEPYLSVLQDNELSELIYWMNEMNMWDNHSLSYENVIKAYELVLFIKNSNLPHEYHI